MSAKSIHEADGKAILAYHLTRAPVIKPSPLPAPPHTPPPKLASIHFPPEESVSAVLDAAEQTYPWLLEQGAKFVAKPDQLIKRRGKAGLLALNKSWADARAWIEERAGKEVKVETVTGNLRTFLVEPFCPHKQEEEYYICIHSEREVSSRSILSSFGVVRVVANLWCGRGGSGRTIIWPPTIFRSSARPNGGGPHPKILRTTYFPRTLTPVRNVPTR